MKKMYILFLLTIFNFAAVTSYAQSKNKASEDSTVVIIFKGSESSNPTPKKKYNSAQNNVIKVAPFGFIFGRFPLFYERRINDYFTIQGGVGLTHLNIYRSAVVQLSEEGGMKNISYPWSDNSYKDNIDDIYLFISRQAKLGYMATLQPRVYFGDEAPDGDFIGLSLDYYRYNFQIPGAIYDAQQTSINTLGAYKKEYENVTDIMAHYGAQHLYDRISLEYTVGLGLRNLKGAKYAATLLPNNSILDGLAKYKASGLNWAIGLKVGYHF